MSIVRKFPTKKKSRSEPAITEKSNGAVVNIDKKINHAIQQRLSSFVKEIQEIKTKQKKIEAYQKACNKLGVAKKKKKKNNKKSTPKKTKK